MNSVYLILALIFLTGIAIAVYAFTAPRASSPEVKPPAFAKTLEPSSDWTREAGTEFSGLGESARCDLVFAVADLDDEQSHQLLLHALRDPSDAVALAAAHALVQRGSSQSVNEYAAQFPGERADRLMETLALLQ